MLASRPATRDDLIAFYGEAPRPTVRALVFEKDGEIVGIGGVKMEGGYFIAFSEIKAGAILGKQEIWRAAKEVARMISGLNVTVYAVPQSPASVPFMERLGFVSEGEAYRWRN